MLHCKSKSKIQQGTKPKRIPNPNEQLAYIIKYRLISNVSDSKIRIIKNYPYAYFWICFGKHIMATNSSFIALHNTATLKIQETEVASLKQSYLGGKQ